MHSLEARMNKMKPAFSKSAANKYVSVIRDGFTAAMPIDFVLSIFSLIAYVPNAWGFYWPTAVANALVVPFNYSMGLLSLFVAGTRAKNLTDSLNVKLPKTMQINSMSVIMASEICFIIIAIVVNPKTGIDLSYMGTQGLVASYVVGCIVPNIYKFCITHNIRITMPDQVPQNIAQTFTDIFPMLFSVIVFWVLNLVLQTAFHANLSQCIVNLLSPLFHASDSYIGLSLIAGAMAFFWFVGVQGPSIVAPAVSAIETTNVGLNTSLMHAGMHASHVLAVNTQDYIMNMGGTGSTLVLAFIFLLMSKSVQNKAVGKASVIPVTFGVNEPILFGAPVIMNPTFFLPFVVTPMVNVMMFKFFVDVLKMNSFIATLPWTVPAPIGIVVGTGFAPLAFVYVLLALAVDVLIWYPFFRVYDNDILAQEEAAEKAEKAEAAKAEKEVAPVAASSVKEAPKAAVRDVLTEDTNVMVICAGGGTSGILAKALNKLAKEKGLPLHAVARAYGQHMDVIDDMDLIVLAPQMDSMRDNLQEVADKVGAKLVTTTGRQYIELTQKKDLALNFVVNSIKD
uniref:PTS system lactose-specific EIICB component n=1 Tax=Lactobacillus delbrueckii subsp. indicus TaxID=249265 RepID=B9DQU5_9LACO|nr:phosphotransferase system lactose specific enzyme II [Lactobacillus delbrueckii subsp. indicus]